MGLPRFILTPEGLQSHPIILSGNDAHHCRILRLKLDDFVLVADGQGKEYHAKIICFSKNTVELERGKISLRQPESPLAITLYQGFAKGSKLDLIIQKTTELGVAKIVPVISKYSQMKAESGQEHRLERWQEIIRQAVRQSGRTVLPQITSPMAFEESLQDFSKEDMGIVLQASEQNDQDWKTRFKNVSPPDRVSFWVGPEGGFAEAEIDLAKKYGVYTVSLGPRILRSETAGIIAVSLAQFYWGDLS